MPGLSTLPPRAKGKLAAAFYVINILAGAAALYFTGRLGTAVLLLATLAYMAVTLLFYDLFRTVDPVASAVAAAFSLVGCGISLLTALALAPVATVSPLGFFGLYCLSIGYLILRSTFVPRLLGVLLAIAGLAWLTFFSPSLTERLSPYSMAPGILAEVALTVWLLLVGIDDRRWAAQTSANNAA